MANLPESSVFDPGVYQLELTDPVVGGASGCDNAAARNLANRTRYLKDAVDALIASKAPLASPELTGIPSAPTAEVGTNTTQLATTAGVIAEIANQFAATGRQNLAAAGYQKLPGGLIIQWGGGTTAANGQLAVTFPVAFTTAVYSLALTAIDPPDAIANVATYNSATTAGFNAIVTNGGGTGIANGFKYIAIGK